MQNSSSLSNIFFFCCFASFTLLWGTVFELLWFMSPICNQLLLSSDVTHIFEARPVLGDTVLIKERMLPKLGLFLSPSNLKITVSLVVMKQPICRSLCKTNFIKINKYVYIIVSYKTREKGMKDILFGLKISWTNFSIVSLHKFGPIIFIIIIFKSKHSYSRTKSNLVTYRKWT